MKIEIRQTETKGRGIFSTTSIRKGKLIEVCPIIEIPNKENDLIDATNLGNYRFELGDVSGIALGYGSLYNHSYNPNSVVWLGDRIIKFKARRLIKKGEEITFNYMGGVNCKDPTWF